MPSSADDTDGTDDTDDGDVSSSGGLDEAAVLAQFATELADLRERHGRPGFETMAQRSRHIPGAAGSKNVFNRLVRGIDPRPPRPDVLRGFVLSLGGSDQEVAEWEQRRRRLVSDLQRARAGAAWKDTVEDAGTAPDPAAFPEVDPPRVPAPPAILLPRPASSFRRRRAVLVVFGIAVVAAGAVVLGKIGRAAESVVVSGEVRCDSGAGVVGVYVEAGPGRSGFADFRPVGPGAATYIDTLSADVPYSVHVGCGGTPADWGTDNRSAAHPGSENSYLCHDEAALTAGVAYGRCDRVDG